jgi:hypothetical protein
MPIRKKAAFALDSPEGIFFTQTDLQLLDAVL